MRKTALFALTVVWGIGTILSFFVGRNYEGRRIQKELQKARRRTTRGRMGPGDRDPRRGGR